MDNSANIMRCENIDIAKGIAIVLVSMGHIFQYSISGQASANCFNFIYSFHMPFFFFLSGMVASLSLDRLGGAESKEIGRLVLRRIKTLLMPFFVWGVVIDPFLNHGFSINLILDSANNLFVSPTTGPWFLAVLFFIQLFWILGLVICRYLRMYLNQRYAYIISLIVSFGMFVGLRLLIPFFDPYMSLCYMLSFLAGAITRQSFDSQIYNVNQSISKLTCLVFFVTFCLLSYNFQWGVSSNYLKMACGIAFGVFFLDFIRVAGPKVIDCKTKSIMVYLGKNTLVIYLLQATFITNYISVEITFMNSYMLFAVVMLIATLVALLLAKIGEYLSKIPYLPSLLFGR